MADQDYPDLYADMEASALRVRAAALAYEQTLGGSAVDTVPVKGYPPQPTIAGRLNVLVPPLVNQHIDQVLPGLVDTGLEQLVPPLVPPLVGALVPPLVGELVPPLVNAKVVEITPAMVESEVAELVPLLVPTVKKRPRAKDGINGMAYAFGDTMSALPILQKAPRGRNPQEQIRLTVGGSVIPGVLVLRLPRTPTYQGDEVVMVSGTSVVAVIGDARDLTAVTQELSLLRVAVSKGAALTTSAWQNTHSKAPTNLAFSQADGSGNGQVWIHDGAQLTQVTPAGSKWLAPVVGAFNFVSMLGDKTGALQPYTHMPRGFLLRDGLQILHKVITGQSLALGSRGFVLNAAGEYLIESGRRGDLFTDRVFDDRCLAFAGGPRQAVLAVGTSLQPMREVANGLLGETIASSWSKSLRTWLATNSAANPWTLASVSAVGGVPYATLKKGTTVYTNAIAHVQKAKDLAVASGRDHLVSSVSIIHGESQKETTQQGYVDILQEWGTDYKTDIMAITGQTIAPAIFTSQMTTGEAGTIPAIPLAQLQANDAGHVILVGPKYAYPYFDLYHMLAEGYVKMGEIEARAERLWLAGKRWQPLKPVSITASGKTISVRFNNVVDGNLETAGPIGRLALDTVLVSDPGNFGFTISSGTISSVVVDKYGDGIVITMAANLAGGETLSYALQPTLGRPDLDAGRRGNLRDTDCRDISNFDGQPLYNWAVATTLTVNL